jgi:hypothetical protein
MNCAVSRQAWHQPLKNTREQLYPFCRRRNWVTETNAFFSTDHTDGEALSLAVALTVCSKSSRVWTPCSCNAPGHAHLLVPSAHGELAQVHPAPHHPPVNSPSAPVRTPKNKCLYLKQAVYTALCLPLGRQSWTRWQGQAEKWTSKTGIITWPLG